MDGREDGGAEAAGIRGAFGVIVDADGGGCRGDCCIATGCGGGSASSGAFGTAGNGLFARLEALRAVDNCDIEDFRLALRLALCG